MKSHFTYIIALLFTINSFAQTNQFDSLLKENISNEGVVYYKGIIKNISQLNDFIGYLEKTSPDNNWSDNKKKAFWINAYNAYTIQLITKHYPLKSILEIKLDGKDAWNAPIANFAFTEKNIESKLERLMKQFVNDSKRNKLTTKKIQLATMFEWYKDDFTQNGKLTAYISKYANIEISKKAKVKFLEYNWNLNE